VPGAGPQGLSPGLSRIEDSAEPRFPERPPTIMAGVRGGGAGDFGLTPRESATLARL